MKTKVSVQDVAAYLGITSDEIDSIIESTITRQLSAADRFLESAIGVDYDAEDPRAQELTIMIAAEMYSTRGALSAKQESALRRIVSDFIMQMRLEQEGEN